MQKFLSFILALFIATVSPAFGQTQASSGALPTPANAVKALFPALPSYNLSVLHKELGRNGFLFVGTNHTFAPDNPQIGGIEALFKAFLPTMVLVEGGLWPVAASKEDAIRKHSELGFTVWLAAQAKVPVKSADANEDEEIAFALKYHTPEEVRLYYALRYVPQWRGQDTGMSIEQNMARFLASPEFGKYFPAGAKPTTVPELEQICAERLPGMTNWRDVQFNLSFNGIRQSLLTEIDKTVNGFRNAHIENTLNAAVAQGERVFLITGSTHLARLLPRLREKYPAKPSGAVAPQAAPATGQ